MPTAGRLDGPTDWTAGARDLQLRGGKAKDVREWTILEFKYKS